MGGPVGREAGGGARHGSGDIDAGDVQVIDIDPHRQRERARGGRRLRLRDGQAGDIDAAGLQPIDLRIAADECERRPVECHVVHRQPHPPAVADFDPPDARRLRPRAAHVDELHHAAGELPGEPLDLVFAERGVEQAGAAPPR